MMMDLLQLAKETIPDTSKRKVFEKEGYTDDIFLCIKHDLADAIRQTKVFAKALNKRCNGNTDKVLSSLYWFLADNVALQIDPIGYQYIKKPAALVHGQPRTADCKSFSIFIASVLTNLNIPCRMKFVAWNPSDHNVKHVFVEAYPGTDHKVTLDVNLKKFNTEKTPNYNQRYIDMTSIYSIGALPGEGVNFIPADSYSDGRDVAQMSGAERFLRGERDMMRSERNAISAINGIGDITESVYNDNIDMINDCIGAVMHIFDKGDYNNWEDRIASIGVDYLNGEYDLSGAGVCGWFSRLKRRKKNHAALAVAQSEAKVQPGELRSAVKIATPMDMRRNHLLSMKKNGKRGSIKWMRLRNRLRLLARRNANRKAGVMHKISDLDAYNEPQIAGWFKKLRKRIKKAEKHVANVTKNTVKSVAKGSVTLVKKATTGSLKMVKASVLAPAALVSSKARKELKKTVKSATSDAKSAFNAAKQIVTAPLTAVAKEALISNSKKAGLFFLYTMIPDSELNKYPAKVREKRKKPMRIKKLLVNLLSLSNSDFDKIIRSGIMARYHKTPEAVLASMAKGESINGIGIVEDILKIVTIILQLIAKFTGKKGETVSSSDIPDNSDMGSKIANGLSAGLTAAGKAADTYNNTVTAYKNTAALAKSLIDSPTNMTALTRLTGDTSSNATEQQSDGGDSDSASTTETSKNVDALTSRDVTADGDQQGADKALAATSASASASDIDNNVIAKKDNGNNKMLIIGGVAVAGVAALMLMNKKH
jgi:hypothetical protein